MWRRSGVIVTIALLAAVAVTAQQPQGNRPDRQQRADRQAERFTQSSPRVGEVAPEFELRDLDGQVVRLSELAGKPVVLTTGSYTCPIFRQNVSPTDELLGRYGDRVQILLVYTIEAHPVGPNPYGGETGPGPANTRAGIRVEQPETAEARAEVAATMVEALEPEVRVLLDDMENSTWIAFGRRPNCGFVLDAELRVVDKQFWFSAERTAKVLDRLLAAD